MTNGSYDYTFNMMSLASYRSGFVADNGGTAATAFNALLAEMIAGRTYFDIHTSIFPGGEIRGQLSAVAVAIPEMSTWAMLLLGFATVGGAMRSSKRRHRGLAYA